MQTLRLEGSRLQGFVNALTDWGEVWAPVETAPGIFSLEVLKDVSQARPDVLRTVIPFKKLLLAPTTTMISGSFAEVAGPTTALPAGMAGGPRYSSEPMPVTSMH